MDEIIEELRAHSEPTPVPLALPCDDDLLDAQEQMLITLPGDYHDFLMTVSDVVLGRLEPATVAERTSHTYLPDMAVEAWELGLPRHCIPICRWERGYYCIESQGTVLFWDGNDFSEQEWETIWHWARDVWLLQQTPEV